MSCDHQMSVALEQVVWMASALLQLVMPLAVLGGASARGVGSQRADSPKRLGSSSCRRSKGFVQDVSLRSYSFKLCSGLDRFTKLERVAAAIQDDLHALKSHQLRDL